MIDQNNNNRVTVFCDSTDLKASSIEYPLEPILDLVVPFGSPVVQTKVNQILAVHTDVLCRGLKPLLHFFDTTFSLLEAGHRLPVARIHHAHQHEYRLLVFHGCTEPLLEQAPELNEKHGVLTSQNVHIGRDQLEWHFPLELDALAWTVGQEEPEVYVDNVPVAVEEDVIVVSVLYL